MYLLRLASSVLAMLSARKDTNLEISAVLDYTNTVNTDTILIPRCVS